MKDATKKEISVKAHMLSRPIVAHTQCSARR